MFVILA